ncbi:SRR1-like protein [Manduca sexta]|uniref:SRR1-like domain-containing protein n=1 Tax=Manduca sexta TaxID=7130 RepID=A0A921Z083_MANSE|nr:SRR1-like protein [Manduca sexta]KAG6447902.1 hypothetical protein O3G_MSEX005202 [Manduca sexta]
MSKSNVDSDGFQIVKSKRSTKNKQTKVPPKNLQFHGEDVNIDVATSVCRIQSSVEELKVSEYFKSITNTVSNLLQSSNGVEIVCFGLGHIAECNISRYQLGLLLCLKDLCKAEKVLAHDPIFYKSECAVLKELGIDVIAENNEGCYVISDEKITIFYLPHCPKQLTNNLLWSNWTVNLSNCILICNSFTSLVERQPSRVLSETVPYIQKIFPHTSEVILENNFQFTDIFNDISIHHFPKEKLEKLESDFWINKEKPSYNNTEEFITSLMIEKLNI